MITAPTATGWYVYGVAAAGPALDKALAKVGPFRVVTEATLAAIVRNVDLDEFGEDVLPERLNDRAWLAEKVNAHEEVLQAAAAVTTVVPFRFGAIYRDLDDVRRLLDSRRDDLESTLARLRGSIELGVKAWVDRAQLALTLASDAGASGGAAAGAGRAYLQRRQQEQQLAADVAARCADLAQVAHRRLSAVALDAVANRPQPHELTGRDDEMLLNGAYLVPVSDSALRVEVERLAAEHAQLGISYEITGPWPPHNFVAEGDPET